MPDPSTPTPIPAPARERHRGRSWVRLDRGVYRRRDVEDELQATYAAWLDRLPAGAVLTGLSAARLWGLWLPPLPDDLPVHVTVPSAATHSKRAGVRVRRHRRPPPSSVVRGLPVVSVPETILDCARDLALLDLVVLVDSALHQGLCTRGDLARVAVGRRGAARLREALPWCDARSESPWETLLRVLHRACGIPVTPQVEVRDPSGAVIARFDLLVDGTTTGQEYDGADHLERRRYGRDRRRDSRLAAAGYVRHAWVKEEVLTRAAGIVREADRARGRPHDPAGLRAWHGMLAQSLFSGAGTARYRARTGLRPADGP